MPDYHLTEDEIDALVAYLVHPVVRSDANDGERHGRATAGGASCVARSATTGFWSWFTTVDHKKIGILYGVTAFVFFLVGGVEALLIRVAARAARTARADRPTQYNQMFTMHGTTMVFLVRHADGGRVRQLPHAAA